MILAIPYIEETLSWDNSLATGVDSYIIKEEFETIIRHFKAPLSRVKEDLLTKFNDLKKEWEGETRHLSSITAIAMNSAYQQIIGIGLKAVPLILAEMQEKPGHWFWALKSITGADPVPPEQRGRIKQMTETWLRWGREQGYLR